MTGKELIKLMMQKGWSLDRIRGSHHIMVKEGHRAIPVAVHGGRDVPKGTLLAILKQANMNKGGA